MPAFNRFNAFSTDLTNGKHDFSAHTFKAMWTNTAPVATNAVYGDISSNELANGNGYTTGGATLTVTKSNSSGVEKLVVSSDVVLTASGGSVGPARYLVIYNSTQTTPNKPLVGWYDYGSSFTLAAGENITEDFDQTNGILQIG